MRNPIAGRSYRDVSAVLIAATFVMACAVHFFRLDTLPMGFYVDESSIGYNAWLISRTGADEHGARWPMFFKAFGEYKNPLYIYLLAGVYRIIGYSEWSTRVLSAFCWLGGSLFLYALVRRLTPDRTTLLYVALTIAFTPWLFTLSRVSFELIIVYPLLSVHLWALYRGFEEHSPRMAFASGVAIALCLYAYSTFRLLAPLYCLLVLAAYANARYRREQIAFSIGAVVSAIPYALYALRDYATLTARFTDLTYLHDSSISLLGKAWIFLGNYAGYFSPSFLALFGDNNRRHHTGFGGEFLLTTALLLVIAIAIVVMRKEWRRPFNLCLLAGLAIAPVAAALTRDSHHSLRAFSMAPFVIVLSTYGLRALKPAAAYAAVAGTAVLAALYVIHYFTLYPAVSAVAFQNYGFKQTLNEALRCEPNRVVLTSVMRAHYINLDFFGSLAGTRVPLLTGSREDVRPGDAQIIYDPSRPQGGLYTLGTLCSRGRPGSEDERLRKTIVESKAGQ